MEPPNDNIINLPGIKDSEFETIPDDSEVSLQDLYDQIYKSGELIIIIDKIDEVGVRKGLSSIKAKLAQKMKSAGYQPDNATLEFIVHDYPDTTKSKLQIVFKAKPTVKVHKIIVPQD